VTTPQVFQGTVVSVVDGDTVKLSVRLLRTRRKNNDLGFHIYIESGWLVIHYSFRLLGCNAAERGSPGGDAATANLITLLPVGTIVEVSSEANDKYNRYDANLKLPDGRDLVTLLISEQWAAPWDGTGVRPVPPWPRTV